MDLLFTRNIELKEFFDLLYKSVQKEGELLPGVESKIKLRFNNIKLKFKSATGVQFRHGIDSQYGDVILVMRKDFYEKPKKEYKMGSIWKRPWTEGKELTHIGKIKLYETGDRDMQSILDEENSQFKRRVDTIWVEKNVLKPGEIHDMTTPSWSNLQLHIFEDIELISENNLVITMPDIKGTKVDINFNMDMRIDTPDDIVQELVEADIIKVAEDKQLISQNIGSLIYGSIKGDDSINFKLNRGGDATIKLNKSYNIEKILFPKWLTTIMNRDKIKSITKYDNMKYNDQFYDFLFKLFNLEEKMSKEYFPYDYDFYGESELVEDYYFFIYDTNYLRKDLKIEPKFKTFDFGYEDVNYLYYRITLNPNGSVNNSSEIALSGEVFSDLEKKYIDICNDKMSSHKGGGISQKVKSKKKLNIKNKTNKKTQKNKKI